MPAECDEAGYNNVNVDVEVGAFGESRTPFPTFPPTGVRGPFPPFC